MNDPDDLHAFNAALPERGALLGVDPGTKTIGLALSDMDRRLASSLKTLRKARFATNLEEIKAITDAEAIVGVVIGLPLNMDGSKGPRAQAARAFQRNLAQHLSLPMLLWDERLSTAEARDVLERSGVSSRKQAEMIDAAAAAVILEDAMRAISRATIR